MMHADLNLFYLNTLKSLALADPATAAFACHVDPVTVAALRQVSGNRLRDLAHLPFVLAAPLPNLGVVLARPMPVEAQTSMLLRLPQDVG